ncbi:hypothetical protein I656_00562 [Geobacillus sp. WSUCF1]|nr:hypothetical protein I656_00562 [Geobacillus sp. WSUCF1]
MEAKVFRRKMRKTDSDHRQESVRLERVTSPSRSCLGNGPLHGMTRTPLWRFFHVANQRPAGVGKNRSADHKIRDHRFSLLS